jgi:hypothetical protein
MPTEPIAFSALVAAALVLLTLLVMRPWARENRRRRTAHAEALDTVNDWQPQATRVLTSSEHVALNLLVSAAPGFLILAQVPLVRFLRVPSRNSYADWLARAGNLSADLLLCDAHSRVLAVVDIRAAQESERSQRRHERLRRVLRASNITVLTWRQDDLPLLADVRAQLHNVIAAHLPATAAPRTQRSWQSRPMPLTPLPEMTEIIADGDSKAMGLGLLEPVPSGYFDDLDLGTAVPTRS